MTDKKNEGQWTREVVTVGAYFEVQHLDFFEDSRLRLLVRLKLKLYSPPNSRLREEQMYPDT